MPSAFRGFVWPRANGLQVRSAWRCDSDLCPCQATCDPPESPESPTAHVAAFIDLKLTNQRVLGSFVLPTCWRRTMQPCEYYVTVINWVCPTGTATCQHSGSGHIIIERHIHMKQSCWVTDTANRRIVAPKRLYSWMGGRHL